VSNKYTYSVPFTEEELYRDYVTLRMSQYEIAQKYEVSQKVIWRAMHKMGVPTRVAAKRNQTGPLNARWTGGRILSAVNPRPREERAPFGNGYYYRRDPSHPNANKSGYVAEHIVVATKERGRPLTTDECVHHIDRNRHNNDPSNLIITNRVNHAIWHMQLEEIAVSFMRDGLIAFDPETGYRRIN